MIVARMEKEGIRAAFSTISTAAPKRQLVTNRYIP